MTIAYLSTAKQDAYVRFGITDAEYAVLLALSRGDKTREIATRRGTTDETVRGQRKSVLRKLDARSAAAAVALGYEEGILPP